jgi:hypothetical protein
LNGGTFIQGVNGALGTQLANGSITPFLTESNASSYLQSINGLTTAAGYDITHVFTSNDLIATITISAAAAVPEPASCLLLGFGMASLLGLSRVVRSRSLSASRSSGRSAL